MEITEITVSPRRHEDTKTTEKNGVKLRFDGASRSDAPATRPAAPADPSNSVFSVFFVPP